uniref:receptor protein-tyrosine kinase n=1 Tax=Haemonchus contortus TaxID=6289 RepID=A0A7I4YVI0_HAECO
MTLLRIIFLLLMSSRLRSEQFCATDGSDPTPTWAPSDTCTDDAFANIKVPPVLNSSAQTYVQHDCGIAVILDLDRTYTTDEGFYDVRLFISDTIAGCMSRGIGYRTFIYPMFNSSIRTVCCAEEVCSQQIELMNYDDYVVSYDSTSPLQNETSKANFTYALVGLMKQFAQPNTKCLYNTIVLLTNRVFVTDQEMLGKDVANIVNYGCITFTVIALGNTGITQELLYQYYSSYTQRLFVVPGYNCITRLDKCIRPCGAEGANDCQNEQLTECPFPTTRPRITTTTAQPVVVSTTTPDPSLNNYWHITYLFALSNRTTDAEFQRAVKFIATPLQQCAKSGMKVAVRFLARNNVDSGWLTQLNPVNQFLQSLSADEILLNAAQTIDVADNTTLQLVNEAVDTNIVQTFTDDEPRITLMTDFVSQNFVSAYNDRFGVLPKKLQPYYFEIIAFNELAAEVYQNQTSIPRSHIVADPNYGDSSKNMVTLCPTKKTSVPTIMFIIIGTCAGAVLILIIATVLFRQKYMWLEKLNRFRSHHYGDQEVEDDEMIDYWELSPEQVLIKNEQLGHGAYGQVYKGKLIGPSPGILRHHKNEIAQFSDCDCAVKMLPKYASDSARSEFMHEIELMKSLGFHDNIVSMLGCITSVNKSCLVMEYCANRDLLRFLKQRKTELEISKSIDEQIECTKEFLNFGWQIAQGMCYLGQKNIIHRDLAARNILIAGTDGVKNAKISDFGLSLTTEGESPLSASGRLPIKWLAIECLQRELFSVKSDVWSYGIVLFEMYSMGERPFEDIEPLNLIPHLEAGNRPRRPLLATDKIAEVMTRCWDKVPGKRPSFEEISYIFTGLLEESTEGYGYLALIKTAETYMATSELSSQHERSRAGRRYSAERATECRMPPRKRAITYTTPMSSLDSSDELPHLADNELSKDENTTEPSVDSLTVEEDPVRGRLQLTNLLPSMKPLGRFTRNLLRRGSGP